MAECDIRKFFDVIDHRVAWKAFDRLARGAGVDRLAKKAVKSFGRAFSILCRKWRGQSTISVVPQVTAGSSSR